MKVQMMVWEMGEQVHEFTASITDDELVEIVERFRWNLERHRGLDCVGSDGNVMRFCDSAGLISAEIKVIRAA